MKKVSNSKKTNIQKLDKKQMKSIKGGDRSRKARNKSTSVD